MNRKYYHQRNGLGPSHANLTLQDLRNLIFKAYMGRLEDPWHAWDFNDREVEEVFWLETGFKAPGDMRSVISGGDEAVLFTLLEFVFHHLKDIQPVHRVGHVHPARAWAERMNSVLVHYGDGFFLTDAGEVLRRSRQGLDSLLQKEFPPSAEKSNLKLVEEAVARFRHGSSSRADKKHALSDLGKVLEFYRKVDLKKVVPREEEQRLFEFLNTFSIRHNDGVQKDDYDDVWLDWMFYRALATVHLYWDLVHGRDEPLPSEA